MKQTFIKDYRKLFKSEQQIAACIGFFDGIHLGHQKLINETIQIAKEKGIESALITFDPDPWTVIHKQQHVKHLTPIKDKIRLLSQTGIDHLIIVKFDDAFSKLSPQEFINNILIPLNVQDLICGADFKFGHKGQGDVKFLKENGRLFFDTHVLTLEKEDHEKLGTTQIVQSILRGDLEQAKTMLGRDYKISGYVKQGNRAGTKIGFPTANLDITDEYVIPKVGVYAGYVEVMGKRYPSVVNIGYNPTFNHSERLSIESHILDFNEIIYGELVQQYFVSFLRDELDFGSVEALVEAMHKDVENAREILNDIL